MSRSSTFVSTLATAIFASTEEFSGCASSISIVPSRSRKRPFTVVMTRCLTANSAIEWVGSIVQVLVLVWVAVVIWFLLPDHVPVLIPADLLVVRYYMVVSYLCQVAYFG